MQNRNIRICLVTIVAMVAVMLHGTSSAQVLNTFSTYSMYGLGELQQQGTQKTRSLAGAGVAMRDIGTINLLNPASFSIALRKGILFDLGVEGGLYIASQKSSTGEMAKSGHTTANFRDIAIQMPISKGIGFGLSVTPYSSVGYNLESEQKDSEYSYVRYNYDGSGGITELKFGVGWEITEGLSVGVAAQYFWGNIDREFTSTVYNMLSSSFTNSLEGDDNISVSSLKGQFGVQAEILRNEKRSLTAGVTYDMGGDIKPRSVRLVKAQGATDEDAYAQNDTTRVSVVLPRQITCGVQYSTRKFDLMADFNYQGWGGINSGDIGESINGMSVSYNNVATFKLGAQYTPKKGDVRHYFNRVNYRIGASYGGYQYKFAGEKLSQICVTAGMGMPIRAMGLSKINLGMEWSSLGSTKMVKVDGESIGLIRQNCLKFSVGFTLFGDDYWFQRPQID